jgi:hypothetical protein
MKLRVAMKTNCVTMDVGDARGRVSVTREGQAPPLLLADSRRQSHTQLKLLRVGQTKA